MSKDRRPQDIAQDLRRRSRRDGFVALSFVAAFSVFAVNVDLVDALYQISRAHEDWELDELAVIALSGLSAFIYYARRRGQDHQRALTHAVERERAARESLARSQRLARLGHLEWRRDTGELEVSEEFTEILGRTPDAPDQIAPILAASTLDHDRAAVTGKLSDALVHGKPGEIYHSIKRPDGAVRHLHTIFHQHGQRTTITLHDVTERKKFETELAGLTSRFENILLSAAEGIVEIGGDGRILFANPAALRMTGYDLSEIIGLPAQAVFGPASAETGESGARTQAFIARKNASTFTAESTFSRFELPDGDFGTVAVFHDISQSLADREALHRSNAELQSFAYALSHDLQEPLRMISGYISLLNRRSGGALDEESKEYMDFAVDGAKRMSAMIRGLLEYSRIDRNCRPQDVVNLQTPLTEALQNLKSAIEEAQADIRIHGPLPDVVGASSQLARVMQNLIGNAVKYRKPDIAPIIEITSERREREWVVSVADNGIGIPEKHAEQVFEVFQRLHNRQAYEGTGIGLSVVKRIVERHGGRIWVESQPGNGAVFKMTFPAVEAAAVQGAA